MPNHSNRRTRLDDAIEMANAAAGLGEFYRTQTFIRDDPAHNAAIVARFDAALDIMYVASRQYASRNGTLAAPAWIRFAERREFLRVTRDTLKARLASMNEQPQT